MADNLDDFFADRVEWTGDGDQTHDVTASSEPPLPPKSRKEMRRRRTAKRRRRVIGVIAAVVVVALVAVCGVFAYRALRQWRNDRQAEQEQSAIQDYSGPGTGSVDYTVQSGATWNTVAEDLYELDVIKSAAALTSISGTSTLYPGTFSLEYQMKAQDVLSILSDQGNASGFLEVKSGEVVSDVIAAAAEVSGIDESEFQEIVDAGGDGILPDEADGSFEGWFEPGTYDAAGMSSAEEILQAMVDARVDKLDSLGVPEGDERQEILIEASIAEAEVNSTEYYGKVVRVILNRLDADMPLGMDTTVAYGLGISASDLTNDQLADASNPYNTRVNTGLPPTPISNPGDNAIEAALDPPEGDWLYFITTDLETGYTEFATTEDEFWEIYDRYMASQE